MGLSKIEHHFSNMLITEEQLQEFDRVTVSCLDRVTVSCLKKIFNCTKMFLKKQHGGLGITKPSTIYRATHINFLIKMLNHLDNNFRFIARNSVSFDFKKRGILRTEANRNFLGYTTKDNGLFDTHIKGGFGVQSDWPQLFHLVTKIDAELNWEENTKDIHCAGNAQLILKSEEGRRRILFSKRIWKEIIADQLSKELEQLSELPMQGRLVGNQGANCLMSQNIFRNYKLSDDLISFWYKARHNFLPHYYTLSLWYANQSASCVLDGYSIESTVHVLNGCSKLKNNYSKRHDHIVEKIDSEIKSRENKGNS